MVRRINQLTMTALLLVIVGAACAWAQSDEAAYNYDAAQIDRYLDVEVWADHSDGEYYEGDDIVVSYRVNRDAFVAIYSIDTRGRVSLLFPADRSDDNYVRGGVTYSLPGADANYDLEVNGPEGFENIQIIASRESFPIPDWYGNSGMVCDWDNRADYMDYINSSSFVRYGGQRFAYDRAAIFVNEWEPHYFRPIYDPWYPSWTVYGNCYVDYPWGSSIYVNGIYWGCAPLYIPRISVGWHTITVYDDHGYCWEHDFHVSHYNTIVFNRSEIRPRADVKSKYKEVREVGYRAPETNGYPKFREHKETIGALTGGVVKESGKVLRTGGSMVADAGDGPTKKYVRGSTKVIKTDRGYETDASTAVYSGKETQRAGRTARPTSTYENRTRTGDKDASASGYHDKQQRGSNADRRAKGAGSSSEYYQKKSGGSTKSETGSVDRHSDKPRSDQSSNTVERKKSDDNSAGTYRKPEPAQKSTDNAPAAKEHKKADESRPAVKSSDNTSRSSDDKKSDDRSSSHKSESKSKSKR